VSAAAPPLGKTAGIAVAVTLAVALLGGGLTDIGPWYQGLRQPSWKPPDWAFGPAWTLLYGLTVAAAVIGVRAAAAGQERRRLVAAFLANALLNVMWSALFFYFRRPDWALAQVALLWLSVATLVLLSLRINGLAAWLLVPYLLWVAYAASINAAVVHLNRPFGSAPVKRSPHTDPTPPYDHSQQQVHHGRLV
jgi:translocator protein